MKRALFLLPLLLVLAGVAAADNTAFIEKTFGTESGGNAGIGYHNPAVGTASGAFGLTHAAYADAGDRSVLSYDAESGTYSVSTHGRALGMTSIDDVMRLDYSTQRSVYEGFLSTNYARTISQVGGLMGTEAHGVYVTPGSVARLVTFLGWAGAAQYLKDGTIRPDAAAANGGEAATRALILRQSAEFAEVEFDGKAMSCPTCAAALAGSTPSGSTPSPGSSAADTGSAGFTPLPDIGDECL